MKLYLKPLPFCALHEVIRLQCAVQCPASKFAVRYPCAEQSVVRQQFRNRQRFQLAGFETSEAERNSLSFEMARNIRPLALYRSVLPRRVHYNQITAFVS